jgi:hypothetical protein
MNHCKGRMLRPLQVKQGNLQPKFGLKIGVNR